MSPSLPSHAIHNIQDSFTTPDTLISHSFTDTLMLAGLYVL